MNIVENSVFDTYDIRKMCIDRNLYTRGNSEDYSRMLKFAADADVTMENLFIIADDIAKHSNLKEYGCGYRESVENFIYVLANECVVRNFSVEWESAGYKLNMYDNDCGRVAWVENYSTLNEFVDALAHYGAEYDGNNEVTLIL